MTILFDLAHDGFVGEFHPGARHPGKAVLYVGGASCDRKMTLAMGKFIEDAGFSVLYLGFYLWEGLPKEMWRIPVDYAERAAKWLTAHGYEPCMAGASTGALYTLLSASLIPEIRGAAALCPFDHVMEGMELFGRVPHCSVCQFRGEEYPYSKFDAAKDGWIALLRKARRAGVSPKGLMRWGYETASLAPGSRIRVENINGDVLLTTAAYDIMWPADKAVARMARVLEESDFSHRLTVKVYECRAHGLGVGEMTDEMGGRIKTALAYRAMGVQKELADRARQDVLDWLDAWAGKGDEHEGL